MILAFNLQGAIHQAIEQARETGRRQSVRRRPVLPGGKPWWTVQEVGA